MKVVATIALVVLPVVGIAIASESPRSRLEPIHAVSTKELWSMSPPETRASGLLVTQVYRFDQESADRKDGLSECGIVLVGHSDLGTTPVAFKVSNDDGCYLALTDARDLSDGSVAFDLTTGRQSRMTIVVSTDLEVRVDTRRLGRIEIL